MKNSIFVISLATEIERRKKISTQLNDLNLNFEFYDAIDLRQVDEKLAYSYINNDLQYNKPSRMLTKGEIGCTMSHISLISHCIEMSPSEHILVLEDDAILDPKLPSLLASSKLSSFDWDVIILGYSKLDFTDTTSFYIKEPIKEVINHGNIKIGKVWREWTCGTVGYLINYKSICKFKSLNVTTFADDWEYIKNKLNLKIYHSRPLLIYEDFLSFSSSIENERKLLLKKKRKTLDFYRYLRGLSRKIIMTLKNEKL